MTTMPLAVMHAGLACPLGLRMAPAVAAMRAGIKRFTIPEEMPEATVCRLSTLPADLGRTDRMCTLVSHALDEVASGAHALWPESMELYISLPSPTLGAKVDEAKVLDVLRAGLQRGTGTALQVTSSSIVREGRSGIFTALQRAAEALTSRASGCALVAAVDSLVDRETLAALAQDRLLLGLLNADGRIPGEGAALFAVTRPDAHGVPLGRIDAIPTHLDPECFTDFHRGAALNRGGGLAKLLRPITNTFPGRTDAVVSGQSAETYWGRQLAYAYLRNATLMPEPFYHIATHLHVGDAGAAAGAIALSRALAEFHTSPRLTRPRRRTAVVYDVSDNGSMGAAALSAPTS